MDGTLFIDDTERSSWKYRFNSGMQKVAGEDDTSTPYYKEIYQRVIADVDRYTTDKYDLNLAIQEHEAGYSVGFQLHNHQVGLAGYVQYWHYEKNELKRAKKTFKQVKKAVDALVETVDYTRPPMALITPMMRHALHDVDMAKKQRSGYHIYNWFEELPKVEDWRISLYGDRYPKNNVQSIGDFWGDQNESSREVSVKNEGSRKQIMSYKYASVEMGVSKGGETNSENYHYAYEMSEEYELKARGWKIVLNMARFGLDWHPYIIEALQEAKIPSKFYGEYHSKLEVQQLATLGSNDWNYKF